jgi:hypothetical protein
MVTAAKLLRQGQLFYGMLWSNLGGKIKTLGDL